MLSPRTRNKEVGVVGGGGGGVVIWDWGRWEDETDTHSWSNGKQETTG